MLSTITTRQKQLAQQVFSDILPMADNLGILFYARLFETDPTLRALFHTDMQDQAHTIMMMLRLCIEGLDEQAELGYTLQNLGARHAEYGVRPQDYQTVVNALLWTLQTALTERWTPETADALTAVLEMFVAEMQRAVKPYNQPTES